MKSVVAQKQHETSELFSKDELITLAHLQMRQFSIQSALIKMGRTDVSVKDMNAYIARKFKSPDGFFAILGPKVHELREKGELDEVQTPRRKPRNEPFFFGRN